MAAHSSILAWTEERRGPQSTGSQRVRHDWATEPPPHHPRSLCCISLVWDLFPQTGTENLKVLGRDLRVKDLLLFSRYVPLFATPQTGACQASLSLTISWSLPKFMSIESVMPSNHLIFCRPLLLLPTKFPSISLFSEYPGWFPLGLTGLIKIIYPHST